MAIEQDVLSSALEALRISGSVVIDHTYVQPWAVDIPDSAGLASLASIGHDARVVAFHLAERGEFSVSTGEQRVVAGPGELVVAFGGGAHRMERGEARRSVALADVLTQRDRPPAPRPDGAGATKLLCGLFVLRDPTLNPLIGALPTLLHAPVLDGHIEPIARTLLRETRQPGNGSAFIIHRALEALCAALVRRHLAQTPADAIGLFRALQDARLSRALEHFHREPGAAWTVEALAGRAGLSRSRFSARFVALAGEGPMAYVTRWRMNVAVRLLRRSDLSVAEIGERVGYHSAPAFSRVFKRQVGRSPAALRR